jgi:hypothetical protein
MTRVAQGWEFSVERGPDWLFVRPLAPLGEFPEACSLSEEVWSLLQASFTNRLVLELDQIGPLYSDLVGQLIWLHQRLHDSGGLMRVAGLSADNFNVLRMCQLDGHFPRYADREAAVMGNRPLRPR